MTLAKYTKKAMHEHEIIGMVSALVDSGLVSSDSQDQVAKCLSTYWSDKIADVWSIEDIKALRPDFTDEQCGEILDTALHSFDASVGINWDTLQNLIDTYYEEEGETIA